MANEGMTRDQLAQWAIELVENGCTLKSALSTVGISNSCFGSCLQSVRDLAIRYARARELSADILVDEALEIADSDIDAQVARNRIDIRKWIASKHRPKIYGERIDLNVAQTISILDARREARSRLEDLPALPVLDAQVIPEVSQVISAKVAESNT